MKLNEEQLKSLAVYIRIGDNKEGVPQFRKVRDPVEVDVEEGRCLMRIPQVPVPEYASLKDPVSFSLPDEIELIITLKEYQGHVIVFDKQGQKLNETPVKLGE